jgi:hypothetical protein
MKNARKQLCMASLLSLILFAWTAAFSQLTPSADSYTNTSSPAGNFGGAATINVVSASQTGYIQFDLSVGKERLTKTHGENMKNFKTQLHMASLLSVTLLVSTAGYSQSTHSNASLSQPTIVKFDAPNAGTASGQGTFPQDNNENGAITGYSIDTEVSCHGFLRTPDGTTVSFDAPGSATFKSCQSGNAGGTWAYGINSGGEIVGTYQDEKYLAHGFLRAADGTFTTIDAPSAGRGVNQGTAGYAINPAGTVAGYYIDGNQAFHGFVRSRNGVFTDFDDPNAGSGAGQGTLVAFMNPAGAITGWYFDSGNVQHGYVRAADGTFTTIDGPGAVLSIAIGITPDGTISGYFAGADWVIHSFLRTPAGTMTFFDDPDAGTSAYQGTGAYTLNSEDTVTGLYIDASNVWHGFARDGEGVLTTIDVPGASGTRPSTINAAGAITGYYIDKNNANHGFVRTKLPPPPAGSQGRQMASQN